jgi:tetratricopeptide (TPR) repeat protein
MAHAQATARFADVPSTPAPTAPAPPAPTTMPALATPIATPATPPAVAEPIAAPGAESQSGSAPQAGFTRRLALSHLERAEALEARGDIAQALREYTESVGIDPTLGDAYLRLGALREKMGDPREAELVFSEALMLPDTRAKALLERSHLRRKAGLGALALSDLESAVELDDRRALLEELAQDYVELHAWSAALAVFRRVAASAAENGDAPGLETARLEVRALRVLAAETDPSQERPPKHDWVARALRSIARR